MRASALVLAAIGIGCLGAIPAHAADSAGQKCAALKSFAWPDLVVDDATLVAKGPANPPEDVPEGTVLPEHCLFRATLSPRKGADGQHFGIGMELRLPLDWNGRFAFQGGGGLDGVLHAELTATSGAPCCRRPSRAASPSYRPMAAIAASPCWTPISASINRLGSTTPITHSTRRQWSPRPLINAYYGRKPDYSYFVGCSNGGRNAMIAAQRFPTYFDGIVAGDPTFRLAWTNVDQVWNEVVLARAAPKDAEGRPIISQALSESDLKLVSDCGAQGLRRQGRAEGRHDQ